MTFLLQNTEIISWLSWTTNCSMIKRGENNHIKGLILWKRTEIRGRLCSLRNLVRCQLKTLVSVLKLKITPSFFLVNEPLKNIWGQNGRVSLGRPWWSVPVKHHTQKQVLSSYFNNSHIWFLIFLFLKKVVSLFRPKILINLVFDF